MTSSDSTPPPPNPYVATPATPPPAGPPTWPGYAAPAPARTGGWSWRATIAGAIAGGVLAASVAVPVTWALTHTSGTATVGPGQAQPGAGSPPDAGTPPERGGSDPFGGDRTGPFGGSASTQRGDRSDATADQSQGVVLIDTQTTAGEAAGTGLVLDASGLVLTNYHVVEGSTQVQVTVVTTGDTYDATVVGHDQDADIALLQLDGASGLATVAIDDDGDPAVSDEVTAVGNADGQGFLSASSGHVVALDQAIDTQDEGLARGEHLTDLIQTDAYVVGGYSGGALLDDEGEVVGVTTAASGGGRAESYAVPIEDALAVVEQIESGEETDGVQVGPAAYLGVAISTAGTGVQVAQVEKRQCGRRGGHRGRSHHHRHRRHPDLVLRRAPVGARDVPARQHGHPAVDGRERGRPHRDGDPRRVPGELTDLSPGRGRPSRGTSNSCSRAAPGR